MKALMGLFVYGLLVFYNPHAFGAGNADQYQSSIHWQAYSEKIFVQAKNQNKIILLLGKAKWCHWCKQLEETTLQDKNLIQLINDSTIPVLVDVDDDAAIAAQYKLVTLPTILILGGDNKIIKEIDGYVSAEDLIRELQPILQSKNKSFDTAMGKAIISTMDSTLPPSLQAELEKKQLILFDDAQYHYWGQSLGEKRFLDMFTMEYAMHLAMQGNKIAENWAQNTLNAQYALIDPVWHGVYLYSTHGDWMHPNYYKSTIDQAEYIRIYLLAYSYWHNSGYLLGAQNIMDYVDDFLTSPEGVFYAGQSAYSLKNEINTSYYQLDNLSRVKLGIPVIDKHIYADINGQMINALTYMYMMTSNHYYLNRAIAATDWVEKNLKLPDGGFKHSVDINTRIYLADTLSMVRAYSTLFRATINPLYLERAKLGLHFINEHFQNKGGDGFVSYIDTHFSNKLPMLDVVNNILLIRVTSLLYYCTGDSYYDEMAKRAMRYLLQPNVMSQYPPAYLLLANERITTKPIKIVVVGEKNNIIAENLYEAALKYPSFHLDVEWLDKADPEVKDYPLFNKPVAYACANGRCSSPIFDPKLLDQLIRQLSYDKTKSLSSVAVVAPKLASHQKPLVSEIKLKSFFNFISENIFYTIAVFWLLGVLLAFTPCVLPLILVLTSFLAAQAMYLTKRKILALSLTYVLSLALAYAITGMVVAMTGVYLQMYMQNSWVLVIFSLLFAFLGFSLLGLYMINIPLRLHRMLVKFNTARACTTYLGAAAMGMVVTIIASPCAAAPFVGTLAYVAQTGNMLLGFLALFAMGIGVGTPILMISLFGVNLLPKVQTLQEGIKIFFGLLLLGMAIWFLARVIPAYLAMILLAALAILTALNMGALSPPGVDAKAKVWRMLGILTLLYGIALFAGGMLGNSDWLQPLKTINNPVFAMNVADEFILVHNKNELMQEFVLAQKTQHPILLDFYADWCASCKEIDDKVFANNNVKILLPYFILLRVDLSANGGMEKALAKQYGVFAPPAILFLDEKGSMLSQSISGDVDAGEFALVLRQILSQYDKTSIN